MNLVDLREPAKVLNTYKGFEGAVTGIACSTIEPYIVSVSLDRKLRIHHMNTKELLKKVESNMRKIIVTVSINYLSNYYLEQRTYAYRNKQLFLWCL